MADSVNSYILANGFRNYSAQFTNLSDGTGETAVAKLDPTSAGDMGITMAGALYYPTVYLKIKRIEWTVQGMTLRILWDATTDVDLLDCSDAMGVADWSKFGGMKAPAVAGVTGKVLFTTANQLVGSSYSVTVHAIKSSPQV